MTGDDILLPAELSGQPHQLGRCLLPAMNEKREERGERGGEREKERRRGGEEERRRREKVMERNKEGEVIKKREVVQRQTLHTCNTTPINVLQYHSHK